MEIIQEFGKIAGIAGISLGVFLFLFKDLIAKNIFPKMTREQGYKTIRLTMFLVWSIAIAGIGTWAFFKYLKSKDLNNPDKTAVPVQNIPTNDTMPKLEEIKPKQLELDHPDKPTSLTNKPSTSHSKNENVKTEIHNTGTIGNIVTGKDVKVEIKEQKIETSKEKND